MFMVIIIIDQIKVYLKNLNLLKYLMDLSIIQIKITIVKVTNSRIDYFKKATMASYFVKIQKFIQIKMIKFTMANQIILQYLVIEFA